MSAPEPSSPLPDTATQEPESLQERLERDHHFLTGVQVRIPQAGRAGFEDVKNTLRDAMVRLSDLRAQVARQRHTIEVLRRVDKDEVWVWQNDDEDHPESLACPVLMSAEHVRAFVADRVRLAASDSHALALRALIHKWRAKGAEVDTYHATMGIGYKACAYELEDLLSDPPSPSCEGIATIGKEP